MNERGSVRSYSTFLLLGVVIFLGLLLRLDFLIASDFVIDSDEAIVGLMAKHIVDGEPIPVFYYGQHYMGSLEPLLLSVLFLCFGEEPALIKVVPLFFSLLFIGISFLIGRELGGRRVGISSALLTAVAPSTLLVWSAKARGGFIEIVVLMAYALYLTLTLFPSPHRQRAVISSIDFWRKVALIGLLLGFGWWVNNQVVYVYPVIGGMILFRVIRDSDEQKSLMPTLFFTALIGVFFALLGSLPFWIYNLQYDFASLAQIFRDGHADVGAHLAGFFRDAFPILLGAKRYWQTAPAFPYSVELSYLLISLISVFALVGGMRGKNAAHALVALFGVGITATTVFVMSPYGYLSQAPRYLLPLYIVIFPVMAGGIGMLRRWSKPLSSGVLICFLGIHLFSAYGNGRAIPGEPFVSEGERVSRDHGPLLTTLRELQISHVQTNYWIGYRLAYESDEAITFSLFQEPNQIRIPRYEERVHPDDRSHLPFVLVPSQERLVARALTLLGYSYERRAVGGYVVLYHLEAEVPNPVVLSSDRIEKIISPLKNATGAEAIVDGVLQTRWASGEPQRPGMKVEVYFEQPVPLAGLQYELGAWRHDYPRRLRLTAHGDEGSVVVLSPHDYEALAYLGAQEAKLFFPSESSILHGVKRLELLQEGEHPLFDWSIAELHFFLDPGRVGFSAEDHVFEEENHALR
ncbi:hypothetical protein MRY87_00805 [bacterium]|nr:hypothetical protein [bacterium]